jgi:hypothetical protein
MITPVYSTGASTPALYLIHQTRRVERKTPRRLTAIVVDTNPPHQSNHPPYKDIYLPASTRPHFFTRLYTANKTARGRAACSTHLGLQTTCISERGGNQSCCRHPGTQSKQQRPRACASSRASSSPSRAQPRSPSRAQLQPRCS